MRKDKGQSLVELALLLPLLCLILVGIIDLGRAFNAYIVITNAAREGARYGALHPDDTSGIKARVINEAVGSGVDLTPDDIQISSSSSGNPIRVTVTYNLPLIAGLILGGSTVQVQSSVEMVVF